MLIQSTFKVDMILNQAEYYLDNYEMLNPHNMVMQWHIMSGRYDRVM